TDQPSIDIVPYVQEWLKEIGIKIDPQTLNSNKLGNVILAGDYDMFVWGWYPNPDPNYILNIFTCAQRPPNPNVYRNSDSYTATRSTTSSSMSRRRRSIRLAAWRSSTRCSRSCIEMSHTSCSGTTSPSRRTRRDGPDSFPS